MRRLIFLTLVSIIIGASHVYSIEPNCRNECYETIPYTTREMLFVMPGCPDCTVRVVFLTRYGTCDGNPVRDIYIEQMTGNRACNFCSSFNNLSRCLEETLKQILTRYRWDDLPTDALAAIKVKYPPCIRAIGKASRVFCLNGECCIHKYEILVRAYDNLVIDHRLVQNPQVECPTFEDVECEHICSVYVEPPYPTPIMLGTNKQPFVEYANLQVYPNPSDDKIEIKLPQLNEVFSLEIYNFMGELIYEQDPVASNRNIAISLSKYPSGLYHLILKTRSGQTLKKYFIINH